MSKHEAEWRVEGVRIERGRSEEEKRIRMDGGRGWEVDEIRSGWR